MSSKLTLIKPEPDPDPMATAYKAVRDATFCQEGISNAQKVAVLELVKHEIVRNMQSHLDGVQP